jgi:hypothetical protein
MKHDLNIIILFSGTLTNDDLIKFGFHCFSQRGYSTQLWNFLPLHLKDNPNVKVGITGANIINISFFQQLHEMLHNCPLGTIAFDYFIGMSAVTWKEEKIYRLLKKYKIQTIVISHAPLPIVSERISEVNILRKNIIKFKSISVNKLKWLLDFISSRVIFWLTKHNLFYPIPLRIFSCESDILRVFCKRYDYNRSHIIPIHTQDHEAFGTFLESADDSAKQLNNTCVHLDDAPTHHPDSFMYGHPIVEQDNYFSSMNRLFDKIEKELDLQVIIAAHPRSNYENNQNAFGERTILKGKTLELVAKSSLVVMHESTSVSFAVLFKKPILSVRTRDMTKNVYNMADALGIPVIQVDNETELENLALSQYCQPNANYEDYLYKHVKSKNIPDNEKLWDIVEPELIDINNNANL